MAHRASLSFLRSSVSASINRWSVHSWHISGTPARQTTSNRTSTRVENLETLTALRLVCNSLPQISQSTLVIVCVCSIALSFIPIIIVFAHVIHNGAEPINGYADTFVQEAIFNNRSFTERR